MQLPSCRRMVKLPAARGQTGSSASKAQPPCVRSRPDTLQARIASPSARMLAPSGPSAPSVRITSRMVRPASLRCRLREVGQHAGVGQIAARRLRGAARRIPEATGTSMSSASSTVASRCSDSTSDAPRTARSSIGKQAGRRPPPGCRIGDVDQRQPVLQRGCCLRPAARRIEFARGQPRSRPRSRQACPCRTRATVSHQRRQHARRLYGSAERRASSSNARRPCAPSAGARDSLEAAKQQRAPQQRIARARLGRHSACENSWRR